MTDIGDFTHVQRQFLTYQTHVIEQDGGLIIQVVKPGEPPERPPYCPEHVPQAYPCGSSFEECEERCAAGTCPNSRCPPTLAHNCIGGAGLCYYILSESWCTGGDVPRDTLCWCNYQYVSDNCDV